VHFGQYQASCAGVTGSVGITRHAHATQMAGLRSSQPHSLAAYGSAPLLQPRLTFRATATTTCMGTQAVRADSAHAHMFISISGDCSFHCASSWVLLWKLHW